jgi:hypothetical protein
LVEGLKVADKCFKKRVFNGPLFLEVKNKRFEKDNINKRENVKNLY